MQIRHHFQKDVDIIDQHQTKNAPSKAIQHSPILDSANARKVPILAKLYEAT